ncbi:hypothetical protein GF325_12865 [Candidatus Bathyarchaeota archaeon]|nr:hypothetical protein [Candidatus Bathyarchaeota archaeon]
MSEKGLYSEVKKKKMEALGKAKIVKAVEKHGKILSIKGQYDDPNKVMKHTYAAVKDDITPGKINKVDLNKYDLVVVGCPGNEISSKYFIKFREFVEQGGWLLTTDWVLKTIVEPLFPGYIRWNGEKTGDVVVSCSITDPSHPFMDGVVDSLKSYGKGKGKGPKSTAHPAMKQTFKWWLEDKSFPIDILRKNDVKVLIDSYEIKKKWGAAPVFVYFPFGQGVVAHFISHTHLQKGASKGKFASAIIITNLLDECIKFKYGLDAGRQRGGYQDLGSSGKPIQSSASWDQSFGQVVPPNTPQEYGHGQPIQQYQPSTTQQPGGGTPQLTPDPSKGIVPDFGGVAQAIENQLLPDPTIPCTICGRDFSTYQGKVMECNECHAMYHEECLVQQIDLEGVCKSCRRVLLY